VDWLRYEYRCGIILSEQYCATGEIPDAIGWKGINRSVVIECKVSRADFLADANKPFRMRPDEGLGCERLYMAPRGVISPEEIPGHWGLIEYTRKSVALLRKPSKKDLRSAVGLAKEMNLLLASLRRVEVRIEPQTITEFLKWTNRMTEYNGGVSPTGMERHDDGRNSHLTAASE
jgi:hypothetical protein